MGQAREPEHGPIPEIGHEPEADSRQPWELIDKGRYRPRRIRGSFRGRELG
jgi:hypothetical protein